MKFWMCFSAIIILLSTNTSADPAPPSEIVVYRSNGIGDYELEIAKSDTLFAPLLGMNNMSAYDALRRLILQESSQVDDVEDLSVAWIDVFNTLIATKAQESVSGFMFATVGASEGSSYTFNSSSGGQVIAPHLEEVSIAGSTGRGTSVDVQLVIEYGNQYLSGTFASQYETLFLGQAVGIEIRSLVFENATCKLTIASNGNKQIQFDQGAATKEITGFDELGVNVPIVPIEFKFREMELDLNAKLQIDDLVVDAQLSGQMDELNHVMDQKTDVPRVFLVKSASLASRVSVKGLEVIPDTTNYEEFSIETEAGSTRAGLVGLWSAFLLFLLPVAIRIGRTSDKD